MYSTKFRCTTWAPSIPQTHWLNRTDGLGFCTGVAIAQVLHRGVIALWKYWLRDVLSVQSSAWWWPRGKNCSLVLWCVLWWTGSAFSEGRRINKWWAGWDGSFETLWDGSFRECFSQAARAVDVFQVRQMCVGDLLGCIYDSLKSLLVSLRTVAIPPGSRVSVEEGH